MDISIDLVLAAFEQHISSGKSFPTVADIRELCAVRKVYRMNYGPKGFDQLYSEDHPYVRAQIRLGVNLSKYEEYVTKVQSEYLSIEAGLAPQIELEEDEEPAIEPRSGNFGFKLIGDK